MIKITMEQFGRHWDRGGGMRSMGSLFEKNVEDFVTHAGAYSRSRFASSFAEGGFYGSGTKWKPRASKWGKKFTHPTMIDTGSLKSQIKGKKGDSYNYGKTGGANSKRNFSYEITTNEVSVPKKGKRGRNKDPYRYAAVHNTDPKLGLYTVNQYSSRRPEHRQFIGHSSKLDDFINTHYLPKIFDGIPNDKR